MQRSTGRFWIRWLEVVVVLVIAYSLVLVVDGGLALRLFDALSFGPDAANDAFRDYLRLPFTVLGAVMAGWMALLLAVVHGPLRRREPWAWPAVALSLAAWFVLDTGMSLVLGFPTHALFNLVFAIALAVPLIGLRRSRPTPTAS